MNPAQRRRFNENVYDVVEAIEPLAAAHNVPVSQFALAWVMAQPAVTSPIIGPRTMEQLEDNLDAAALTLTQADFDAVDQVIPPGRMVAPYYEANFGPHRFRI